MIWPGLIELTFDYRPRLKISLSVYVMWTVELFESELTVPLIYILYVLTQFLCSWLDAGRKNGMRRNWMSDSNEHLRRREAMG